MSSLSIPASAAAANLRPQPPTNNVASTPDTRRQPPNANAPSPAGPTATVAPVAAAAGGTTATVAPVVTRLEPTAPPPGQPAPPNADLANQAAQQVTASNNSAADARAVQAGSSAIRSFLDITV
jgi:hypothetical protein